ncbi:MAG: ATP-binding protein [Pseudomonadota bacterium]|nr:ATP-binding protein [Pseudomonadota bacterium]
MSKGLRLRAPASLLGRTNLTLGVSGMLIAVISTIALYVFVIDPIAERSADDEAALLVLSAQTWVELPPAARPYFELELAQNHDLIISAARQELPVYEGSLDAMLLLQQKLQQRLATEVVLLDGDELVWAEVPMAGYSLQIGVAPDRRDTQPLYVAIIIVSLGAAIVFFTSLFVVQRVTRPLVKVAKQAERFRGLENIEPLAETGPRELVSLARNFNTMASEISMLLANRTTLMAGISHDLRTPLTRMRLALALLPDDIDKQLVRRFENNLESMDELIRDALRFAKGAGEKSQEFELVTIVEDTLGIFEQDVELRVNVTRSYRVILAPNAFSRVLTNLVANGFKHGGQVIVTVTATELVVMDNGPGIPPEHRSQIFQPFFRLDRSRNATTGGSGLGLAIVDQLCQTHGWTITVGESPLGGAKFTLVFDSKERSD